MDVAPAKEPRGGHVYGTVASRAPAVPAAAPPPPPAAPGTAKSTPAEVIFGYDAAAADELSLTVGETVFILCKNDDGWYEVLSGQGQRGLVPGNYVQERGHTEC